MGKSRNRNALLRILEIAYRNCTAAVENGLRCFTLVLTPLKPKDSLRFIHGVEGSIFSFGVAKRTRCVSLNAAGVCENGKNSVVCGRYAAIGVRVAAVTLAIFFACSGSVAAFAVGCAVAALLYAKCGVWCFAIPPVLAACTLWLGESVPEKKP